MKTVALTVVGLLTASSAIADYPIVPIPAPAYSPPAHISPAPLATPHVAPAPYIAPAIPEYAVHELHQTNIPVRYEDLRKRHPCAVPVTVCVETECGPVLIEICVPPNCHPEIKHRRRKICYDYGKYEVEIHDRRNGLVVDYDN